MKQLLLILILAAAPGRGGCAQITIDTDICVYGGTSGGVVAALQAKRMGKTVSLAVFGRHLGGLTTGGLGSTDKGAETSIGGLAREFYERVGRHYGKGACFKFEPHVARQVYGDWLGEAGIAPVWNQRLASVTKAGPRLSEIKMEDGTVYRAKMFIDATYEGDLMAMAGVDFTFGREATNVYGESLNGIRARTTEHQFTLNIDPYIEPGKPDSGLLPFIQPGDGGVAGAGDNRIQAFNYRLCLTTNATNRLPHVTPPNYDPARYELLGRLLDACAAARKRVEMHTFMGMSYLPNGKTDLNNRGPFSTDFIGMNYTYPTNTYAARARMDREHLEYIQGMIHYLATSPRSPAALRAEVLQWGPCKDEWPETGGYPPQIYVREARRMVGDYVMTEADCLRRRIAPDPICLASYAMDSHNCQRIVQDGFVRNEGNVESSVRVPYPVSYRAIIPRAGECENLLVTVAVSASHIAFGSVRMEPVFMMISQSAATAAALAIDGHVAARAVNYARLRARLSKDGQLLDWPLSNTSH